MNKLLLSLVMLSVSLISLLANASDDDDFKTYTKINWGPGISDNLQTIASKTQLPLLEEPINERVKGISQILNFGQRLYRNLALELIIDYNYVGWFKKYKDIDDVTDPEKRNSFHVNSKTLHIERFFIKPYYNLDPIKRRQVQESLEEIGAGIGFKFVTNFNILKNIDLNIGGGAGYSVKDLDYYVEGTYIFHNNEDYNKYFRVKSESEEKKFPFKVGSIGLDYRIHKDLKIGLEYQYKRQDEVLFFSKRSKFFRRVEFIDWGIKRINKVKYMINAEYIPSGIKIGSSSKYHHSFLITMKLNCLPLINQVY